VKLPVGARAYRLLQGLSGSNANADRLCFIDSAFMRGLRLVAETGGTGTGAATSRRRLDPTAGRRSHAQIRVQRRHDFGFANRLPR
jgi:hypothetical protein